jgi:hypothetical protein
MSCPETTTLEIYAGDDDSFIFEYMEDDGVTPIDITGYTGQMQMRTKSSNPTASYDQVATVDGPNGKLTFPINDVQSSALNTDNKRTVSYVFDVEIVSPSGDKTTIIGGSVNVCPQVTRV